MAEYYVGTLSGTSADGIDVVLVDFAAQPPKLIAARTAPLPAAVRHEIRALAVPGDDEIERLGRLDVTLGRLIATAINDLLAAAGVASGDVVAVGSHGQTLRHRPDADPPFTLQVGDPNTIAALTGIATVADFRRMDMALGGQGAPLAPIFHAAAFRETGVDTAVLNIGGIANLTLLPGDESKHVSGFDTGPGNCLMDEWAQQHLGKPFDAQGAWAAAGTPLSNLVDAWLDDPYFAAPIPKSTGREHFNLAWAQAGNDLDRHTQADVQATLLELTVASIARALYTHFPVCERLLVCGGGAHNPRLMVRLSQSLQGLEVDTTMARGVPPDWVEGCAFAHLARARQSRTPVTTSRVTGSRRDAILGVIHLP